jgi:hypothetical protein
MTAIGRQFTRVPTNGRLRRLAGGSARSSVRPELPLLRPSPKLTSGSAEGCHGDGQERL